MYMKDIVQQYKKTVVPLFIMIVLGIALLIFSLIIFMARKTSFIGSGVEERATITVNGTGKLNKIPDTARISFTVSDTQKTLAAAQQNVSSLVASLTEKLTTAGISEEDITTDSYTSYPKYDYPQPRCFDGMCPPAQTVLVGYTLSHSLTVKISDLEKVETVLGLIGEGKVENMSGPSFGFSDEEQVSQEVRALAIENAEEQARILARDLGVRIVRVVSYSEQSDGGMMLDYRKEGLASAMAQASPTIPIGNQNLEKTVSVTYEIR